jgi:hypothetical protein
VDSTPPIVSWNVPTTGTTVRGVLNEASANCLLTADDDVGVTSVVFRVDGRMLNTEPSSPGSWVWDTTNTPNGMHTLSGTALDSAGDASTSTITVRVANASPLELLLRSLLSLHA